MSDLDHTHDPKAQSWIESANDAATDFPIQNLPLGVFSVGSGDRHVGTAIGGEIVDLLLGLAREHGTTLLAVTHDTNLAARGDRVLHIRDGALEEA